MRTPPTPHRSLAVTVQARPDGHCVLSVHVTHTMGYPHTARDFTLEVEQVYERTPSTDELLAIAARLVQYAQAIRGREATRPTPISSHRRPAEQAGAPRRGATGGGTAKPSRVTRTRDGQTP